MKSKEKIRVLHDLRYAGHILHSIPEREFNYFIGANHSRFNSSSICSCLLVLLNDLNDNRALDAEDFKRVCLYLKTDPGQSFADLVRLMTNRATGNDIALTLAETQRLLQGITYLIDITDPSMRDNKISYVSLWLRGLLEFLFMRAEGLSLIPEPALA